MRFFNDNPLLGATMVIAVAFLNQAQSLSIKGMTHAHFRSLNHAGKRVKAGEAAGQAAGQAAVAAVSERNAAPTSFSIELVNKLDSADIHAYIQSTEPVTNKKILITADGEVYKPVAYSKDVATPIPQSAKCGIRLGSFGSTTTIAMPMQLLSARIYVASGELDFGALQNGAAVDLQQPAFDDPNFNVSFGVLEASQSDSQSGTCLYANPTYVDFAGLPLAMELIFEGKSVNMSSLPTDGVKRVCELLKEEEDKDGYPWMSKLCLKGPGGEPLRVLSPRHGGQVFDNYFDDYIEEVWTRLSVDGIRFNLQTLPSAQCWIEGDFMTCEGGSQPFQKPTTNDIWGCASGPFANTGEIYHDAIGSRFCAAFHGATLLLPGGAEQPYQILSKYYQEGTRHNKYAKVLHQVQVHNLGYAFPYDDVKPDFRAESEVSGTITAENPSVFRIFVGGSGQADAQHQHEPEGPSDDMASKSAVSSVPTDVAAEQPSEGSTAAFSDVSTDMVPSPGSPKDSTPTQPSSAEPLSSYPRTLEVSATRKALSLPQAVHTHDDSTLIAYSPPADQTTQEVVVVNVKTVEVTTTTTVFSSTTTVLQ